MREYWIASPESSHDFGGLNRQQSPSDIGNYSDLVLSRRFNFKKKVNCCLHVALTVAHYLQLIDIARYAHTHTELVMGEEGS